MRFYANRNMLTRMSTDRKASCVVHTAYDTEKTTSNEQAKKKHKKIETKHVHFEADWKRCELWREKKTRWRKDAQTEIERKLRSEPTNDERQWTNERSKQRKKNEGKFIKQHQFLVCNTNFINLIFLLWTLSMMLSSCDNESCNSPLFLHLFMIIRFFISCTFNSPSFALFFAYIIASRYMTKKNISKKWWRTSQIGDKRC